MDTVYTDETEREYMRSNGHWFSRDPKSGWPMARNWLRASLQYNNEIDMMFADEKLTVKGDRS